MLYDSDGRDSLLRLQKQAARKLAEIHQLVAPGIKAPVDPEELMRMSRLRMAELSPPEREKMRAKAIVAASHLERLMSEMSSQLANISEELRKVNRQSHAVGAYSKTARMNRRPSAFL